MRGLKLRRIAVWLMNLEYIDNTSGFIITYYIAAYIYIMVKCTTVILLTSGRARRSLWRLEGGKTNDGRALNGRRQACRHGSKGGRDGRLSAMPLLTPWFYFCPPKIRNRGVLRETLRKTHIHLCHGAGARSTHSWSRPYKVLDCSEYLEVSPSTS